MKKLLISAAAAALTLAAPASAATFVVTAPGSPVVVPNVNDFKGELAGLGYLGQLLSASVSIQGSGWVHFEVLGSESGFSDTFKSGAISYTETSSGVLNFFGSPIYLGSVFVSDGMLLDVAFTNSAGAAGRSAGLGDEGFAVFLKSLASDNASYSSTEIIFGYDDQAAVADDNHDDLLIRATISPVPEPATWAMMVGGIAAVGFAMRRRPRSARVSFS